jgi:hypothetical protein
VNTKTLGSRAVAGKLLRIGGAAVSVDASKLTSQDNLLVDSGVVVKVPGAQKGQVSLRAVR